MCRSSNVFVLNKNLTAQNSGTTASLLLLLQVLQTCITWLTGTPVTPPWLAGLSVTGGRGQLRLFARSQGKPLSWTPIALLPGGPELGGEAGSRLGKDYYSTVVISRSPKQKQEPREQQERGRGKAIPKSGMPAIQHRGLTAGLVVHACGKVPFRAPWDIATQLLLALFTPCTPTTVKWA